MKVPRPGIFRRPAADGKVQVGIFQSDINFRQQCAQHAGQVGDLHFRDVAEAGHVAQRENVGGKWSGGSKDFQCHEALALDHDARFIFHFLLHHVTEHAFANVVIVAQGFMQTVPDLAGNNRSRN